MADNGSLSSPKEKNRKSSSFIFSSPRLFTGFTSKGFTDTESVMSPTSILDSKTFSVLKTTFWFDSNTSSPRTPKPESKIYSDKLESKGVGLGLVDVLNNGECDSNLLKQQRRMILFGSKLKIRIPPQPLSVVSRNSDNPPSSGNFGIKSRKSQLGSLSPIASPCSSKKSPFGSSNSGIESPNLPRIFSGSLSAGEMELSEDYTCVITHGPNPRTTHIFDDCIIESCCGIVGFSASPKIENGIQGDAKSNCDPSESFLSFCYNCKKHLGKGKDIYIYRGEKAFCSSECRYKEIIVDEGDETSDDMCGT